MDLQTAPSYFLAASAPSGFCSHFPAMYDPDSDWRCVILKGGPGSGKSTLMKKAAQQALADGDAVELIYCSSDPRSLDGVILPEHHRCMADGTAPHILEARCPGACERIFDPGECWNHRMLYDHRNEIRALGRQIDECHRRAGHLRTAAAALQADARSRMAVALDREKLENYCRRLCRRHFPGGVRPGGRVIPRFLSGITPDGWITFGHTLTACARHIVLIADDTGLAAPEILSALRDSAAAHGETVICCGDPLRPETPDALLLPQRQEAFALTDRFRRFAFAPDRTVHTRRFFDPVRRAEVRSTVRQRQKEAAALLNEAVRALAEARALHDRLEAYYMAATDYHKLNEKSNALLQVWRTE
ncbi:MAG: hypothetical protein IJY28_06340 [Clostridia bacterium]|nr:hypothetical protein [Clostridia bacterium]